jgi:hypothetical protein
MLKIGVGQAFLPVRRITALLLLFCELSAVDCLSGGGRGTAC